MLESSVTNHIRSSPTAGGSEPVPRHIVRLARDSILSHLASGAPFPISTVSTLDALGRECSVRFGDADVLDQLTFRLRQRLERQLAIISVVRRGRTSDTEEPAC